MRRSARGDRPKRVRAGRRVMIGLAILLVTPLGVAAAPSPAGAYAGTWTNVGTPTGVTATLRGVSCTETSATPPVTTCYAVGSGGNILRMVGSAAATSETSPTTAGLYGVSCSDADNCVAVGRNGTIIRRTSTGTPPTPGWVNVPFPTPPLPNPSPPPANLPDPSLFGVSCTVSVCFAVGATQLARPATVLASFDKGNTWVPQNAPALNNLAAIDCSTQSTCVATGYFDEFVTTVDGGATWVLGVSNPTTNFDVLGVSCPTVVLCVAVDNNNASGNVNFWRSTTAGEVWTQATSASTPPTTRFGVDCAPVSPPNGVSATCFAVGYDGEISTTTDGGVMWTDLTSVKPTPLRHLYGVSCTATTCRAVGDAAKIVKN